MLRVGTSEPFLHVISSDILQSNFDIAKIVSCIVGLVIEILHVLELRMLPG